jgi:hypothetical protein
MTGDRPPSARRTEVGGTLQQQLVFLNTHWGSKYSFTAPAKPGSRWTAAARFGQHDRLAAESAAELLDLVRGHYQASRPTEGEAQ